MCGIVGFISTKPFLTTEALERMRARLAHRGPDDTGINLWSACGETIRREEQASVGLAHCRLSVMDLTPAGRQPMCNENDSIWITYNGEFYNFDDYRADLEQNGHIFRSRCDTETILHLYEDYGIEETLRRMNGMFAFGLWDKRNNKLILARDRIGQKPMYYTMSADGCLMFASTCEALIASGKVDTARIDNTALAQFWSYGYTIGERTIFEQIRRLLPGHYAVWQNGKLTIHRYWDCLFGTDVFRSRTLDDMAEELESLLCDAIRLRLISDVPLGLFLSGGIDSSLIAALTRRVVSQNLQSFTIAFPHDHLSEAPHAEAIARHLNIANTALTVNDNLDETCLAHILGQFDEPFGDSSSIPTYFVSKLARKHVTVALTGDGGDEIFGGYDSYLDGLRLWGNREQRKQFHRPVHGMQRIWDMKRRLTPSSKRLTVWERQLGPLKIKKVLSKTCMDKIDRGGIYYDRERWYSRIRSADILSQMQYTNFKTYLPDDILVKVDRMSMAHALECRSPFLDYRVVEFAARLPYFAKIDESGRRKVILRKILSKYVSASLTEHPKKGFSIPLKCWDYKRFVSSLPERWLSLDCSAFAPCSVEFLFPRDAGDITVLQWNAFATIVFFESAGA